MGQFQRDTMRAARAALAGLALLLAPLWARAEVVNLQKPGGFSLRAPAAPLSLAGVAHMEKRTGAGWITIARNILLVEQCSAAPPPACVTIAPGAAMTLAHWPGYSCASQCNLSCKANVYLGPGEFRLKVFACGGGQPLTGPVFRLPAR